MKILLLRLQLLILNFCWGVLLILLLCLGAQNLKDKHSIRVGNIRSVSLPTGFLVGVSLVIGVISGGSAAAILLPKSKKD